MLLYSYVFHACCHLLVSRVLLEKVHADLVLYKSLSLLLAARHPSSSVSYVV